MLSKNYKDEKKLSSLCFFIVCLSKDAYECHVRHPGNADIFSTIIRKKNFPVGSIKFSLMVFNRNFKFVSNLKSEIFPWKKFSAFERNFLQGKIWDFKFETNLKFLLNTIFVFWFFLQKLFSFIPNMVELFKRNNFSWLLVKRKV